jgi:hypothetical protein
MTEAPIHVVVAGGGVIGEDGRQQVGARIPARREVEATALAQSGATSLSRGTANSLVEYDETAVEREARRAD